MKTTTIRSKRGLIDLETPAVMGILNLTPDSFFQGSRVKEEMLLETAHRMLEDGAEVLDVGGMSTRPGAEAVSVQEEMDRILPVIERLAQQFPHATISIDTYRSEVARAALDAGAFWVNDISAGYLDPGMFSLVAERNCPYILMHMQGIPINMQKDPSYKAVTADVMTYLFNKVQELRKLGVTDLVVDPGFGFGKALHHNYQLLRNLEALQSLDVPVLVGVSRKSMINKVLGTWPEDALNGTSILHAFALERGAKILRVHDVKEARQAVQLFLALRES
jgi:dihydropteroate synthase